MGWGRIGNHHKHHGGRGMAGSKHHHKTWVNRWHPGYFGKCGFRQYHLLRNREFENTINVSELWKLVPENIKKECLAQKEKNRAPVLDVVNAVLFVYFIFHLITKKEKSILAQKM